MKQIYYGIESKKKLYLKAWVESKKAYQSRCRLAWLWYLAALGILAVCTGYPVYLVLIAGEYAAAILAGLGVGLVLAMIPFLIGQSVQAKAYRENAFPFLHREREYIKLYEDGVEVYYHDRDSLYEMSMDVYRIPGENIYGMKYDSQYHIFTITGVGELLSYDDYGNKRLNHRNSQRRFYSDSTFSFLTAFEEEETVLELLYKIAEHREQVHE